MAAEFAAHVNGQHASDLADAGTARDTTPTTAPAGTPDAVAPLATAFAGALNATIRILGNTVEYEVEIDWEDVSMVRSGVQFVVGDLEPVVGRQIVDREDLERLDALIVETDHERVPFDDVPPWVPESHVWWRGGSASGT